VTDENAAPSMTRVSDDATTEGRAQYMKCARQYFKVRSSSGHYLARYIRSSSAQVLFILAPNYNMQSGQGKTHATFGLCCKSGEATIRGIFRWSGSLGWEEGEGPWCWLSDVQPPSMDEYWKVCRTSQLVGKSSREAAMKRVELKQECEETIQGETIQMCRSCKKQ
jgi:hypothetical protein